ncbi:MAG: ATP-dependent DNA helicase [Rhabdochlamydiaceae bacterium]
MMKKEEEFIDSLFSSKGLLANYHKNFEERSGQLEMSRAVMSTYLDHKITLIEAGTGIGKTLAYLAPAIYWALTHQEKSIISTNTIALQEQLIQKDIPFLLNILDAEVKVVLVKGFGNYLCLKKLNEIEGLSSGLDSKKEDDINRLKLWAEETKEGSHSELPFHIPRSTWSQVSAEASKCLYSQCPHYRSCFLFKARRDINEAQILVVNHHLLFADMVNRSRRDFKEEQAILPKHQHVIFDEAHHVEQIALESLSKRCSQIQIINLLRLFHLDPFHPDYDKLPSSIIFRLETEIPRQQIELIDLTIKTFQSFYTSPFAKSNRLLINQNVLNSSFWSVDFKPSFELLIDALEGFSEKLFGLKNDLEPLFDKEDLIFTHLTSILNELGENISILENFFLEDPSLISRVRWIEANLNDPHQIVFVDTDLNVAAYLNKYLFDRLHSVTLCSATLTTSYHFDYLKKQLGLSHNPRLMEKIFESPFDYQKNSLFLVPRDAPIPSHPDFANYVNHTVSQLIKISKGGVFILFTSYEMLEDCYDKIAPFLEKEGYYLLKQGQAPRSKLLNLFKEHKKNVLFGTDSFWEGVDVVGDQLRSVIIVKLPFKSPDDPMLQAQGDYLNRQNRSAFMDYSLPLAIVKFKQGFGRLMRSQKDRGCVICLDNRLIYKKYGELFIKSLPRALTCFDTTEKIYENMKLFYGSE